VSLTTDFTHARKVISFPRIRYVYIFYWLFVKCWCRELLVFKRGSPLLRGGGLRSRVLVFNSEPRKLWLWADIAQKSDRLDDRYLTPDRCRGIFFSLACWPSLLSDRALGKVCRSFLVESKMVGAWRGTLLSGTGVGWTVIRYSGRCSCFWFPGGVCIFLCVVFARSTLLQHYRSFQNL